ncbi:MAG TPA: hypothetical protein VFD84_10220 [Candidatus Binatia bacterium]|nr:hypothetical protein [Candidatus Binatia bacterium]
MTRWVGLALAVPLLLAPGARAGAVEETIESHRDLETRLVMLGREDRPTPVTLEKGQALEFENQSLRQLIVTFQGDVKDKVHCGIIRPSEKAKSKAPWQLFAWDSGALTAVIPPGRFATLCSFDAGTYTYVVKEAGASTPRARTGTIEVTS